MAEVKTDATIVVRLAGAMPNPTKQRTVHRLVAYAVEGADWMEVAGVQERIRAGEA